MNGTKAELFPSKFFVGDELPEGWRETLTIKGWRLLPMFDERAQKEIEKPVLLFEGRKPMPLNITNFEALERLTGKHSAAEFVGYSVTFYRAIDHRNKKPCIRIDEKAPVTRAVTANAKPDAAPTPAPANVDTATGEILGTATPDAITALPSEPRVAMPTELANALRANARRTYSDNARKGAMDVANGFLDDYAGDTDRRHAFLSALFNVDSARDLKDNAIAALLTWRTHPTARSEVNRVITDYLQMQGQPDTQLVPASA